MTAIIIIGIIIFIIYTASNKKKPKQQTLIYTDSIRRKNQLTDLQKKVEIVRLATQRKQQHTSEKEIIITELVKSPTKNIELTMTSSDFSDTHKDDSIIDVSDQSYKINSTNSFKKYQGGIVPWKHQYIYSYSEINSASNDQQKCYNIFKNTFLNEEYFDLEGNTNYAFILLFDLFNEFDNHKDLSKLENQLKILGQCYPKTKWYGISFLIQQMEDNGDSCDYSRLEAELRNNDNYWGLGNKFNTELNLSDEVTIQVAM